jgi:hypothetical protein
MWLANDNVNVISSSVINVVAISFNNIMKAKAIQSINIMASYNMWLAYNLSVITM